VRSPRSLDIDPKISLIRGADRRSPAPHRAPGRPASGHGQHLTERGARHALIQELVERRGARAAPSGNPLTGQLFVAPDYFPDAPKAKID
jgi:paraquat-inducible protein B